MTLSNMPLRHEKEPANCFRITMNRFLTKRKVPEPLSSNEDALAALSSAQPAQTSPTLKKSATSRWKRGKKPVETKPQANLAITLPSSDDFRTSLLMPNLSARFSMLREQDDPNSLLGKASDDSVLQPRRRSRMDFGFANGGLSDIAEVESSSIDGSIRPPFANGRQDSFTSEDGYNSEGSMMARSRPGEGNVLFGGRQKVYMIPKAGASSSRSLGKAVYEDDIGKSAFQKYRQQQEAQRAAEGRSSDESQGFDFGLDHTGAGDQDDRHAAMPNDSAKDLTHSPSLSSSEKKRSTNSTLHSDARSSTAATSVASQPVTTAPSPAKAPAPSGPAPIAPAPSMQPLKRADTKTRRLYEQGLDQHMHEQQTSALTRLNSIQRQRTLGGKPSPPFLQSTKSTGNLNERTRQPVYAIQGQSPVPSPLMIPALGSTSVSPVTSGPVSPTSPNGIDFEDYSALTQALEPGDRGKATAMGAFNKPKQAFDENQYLERQRQLQRSASRAAVKQEPSAPSLAQQRLGRFEPERQRSDSNASARSRSRSAPKNNEPTQAYNVFQRAANQMNAQRNVQQFDKSSLPDTHRTFFGNISASDSEEEEEDQQPFGRQQYNPSDYGYGTHHGRWQPTVLPSVSEHPALRSEKSKASLAEEDEDVEPQPLPPARSATSLRTDTLKDSSGGEDVDSPTLGDRTAPVPTTTPLNGLMHHLRQRSNVSSIGHNDDRMSTVEAPELPAWNPKNLDLVNKPVSHTIDSESRVGSTYAQSNPWDLDEIESAMRGGDRASQASVSPLSPEPKTNPFESRAPSRSTLQNRRSAVSDLEPELEVDGTNESSWQDELQAGHARGASTATQQERDAFADELAARRNAIQESIKTKVEGNNRSRETSPAPSANGRFKPFGMLRSKPSSESVDTGRAPQAAPQAAPKAMKMLGITGSGANSSSNTLNSQYERGGYSLDMGRSRENSTSRPPLPMGQARALQQSEQDFKRELQQSRSRENSEASRPERIPPSGKSPASSAGGRSRANSEAATGRARSRTGPYRDDLEKAMVEGTGSSAAAVEGLSPVIPRELTPRVSPEILPSHFEPPRARSNSRSAMTNYFDTKNPHPVQTGSREHLAPAGPPPLLISPSMPSPALSSGRPSPLPSPFAQNMTPPLSGASTPLSSTFSAPSQIPPSSARTAGPLRKKTISKGTISEPMLISSTSNFDTIDLPEGASLKNGMDEPPPLPPINPRRRAAKQLFGLARKDSEESTGSFGSRSRTPDLFMRKSPEPDLTLDVHPALRGGPDTRSPRMPATKQSFDQSPAVRQHGFASNAGSPEKASQAPARPVAMEGGMF